MGRRNSRRYSPPPPRPWPRIGGAATYVPSGTVGGVGDLTLRAGSVALKTGRPGSAVGAPCRTNNGTPDLVANPAAPILRHKGRKPVRISCR